MRNTYENSFEINLTSHFILPSVSSDTISIPRLLNLDETTLRTLINSAIVDVFSNYIITSTDEEATISADWKDYLADNENSESFSIKIALNTDKYLFDDGIENYLSYYIEVYLNELFLILNLSIPGSITLFQTTFKVNDYTTRIKIDSYFFAESLEWSNEIHWLNIVPIPINDVATWYKSLNIGIRQISKTNLERVIFSLLHVCNDEYASPTGLIWLSHSLESLFGSPKASICKTMIDRAYKILGKPEVNSKKIKNIFNDFYDLRSKYVHGEFNIHHPSYNNILDDDIDEYYDKMTPSYKIGFSIVVACLQLMILNNWKGFKFREEFDGV
ncbi:hypothetical protein G9F72_018840 [Clostridium estertheticum]|uniref:HEPN domain-containing protein n=1 Tax=Clostridium estertheticum TaxID=238834 RepID=UPI0013E927CA|nr:HEPN domain-containing protein [Clostridium estertheticum]MBZ9688390.1 hypothetical protein [Clostridium estertheticum]